MSTMVIDSEYTAADALELTGATYRQVDYWCRCELLGPTHTRVGSGGRRSFTSSDIEVLAALVDLRAIGCNGQVGPGREATRQHALRAAIDAVRARPVSSPGEWLLVTLDPPGARRYDRYLLDDLTVLDAPLWAVRLRSFSTVAPSDAEGATVLPVVPPPAASDRGAAGSTTPSGARPPGGSSHEGAS